MDFRNVLIAIVLSTLVLVGWGTFFEAPIVKQETAEQSTTKENSTSTPSLDGEETKKNISRTEAISNTDRIKLESKYILSIIVYQCILGVLTLISKGALIFALIHQLLAILSILLLVRIKHKLKYE